MLQPILILPVEVVSFVNPGLTTLLALALLLSANAVLYRWTHTAGVIRLATHPADRKHQPARKRV